MWTVARGYLRAPLCDVFVDLFDEIGDFLRCFLGGDGGIDERICAAFVRAKR